MPEELLLVVCRGVGGHDEGVAFVDAVEPIGQRRGGDLGPGFGKCLACFGDRGSDGSVGLLEEMVFQQTESERAVVFPRFDFAGRGWSEVG
jgi:hypothetical protein